MTTSPKLWNGTREVRNLLIFKRKIRGEKQAEKGLFFVRGERKKVLEKRKEMCVSEAESKHNGE